MTIFAESKSDKFRIKNNIMEYFSTKVISNRKIAKGIYLMEVKNNGATINPGQFYMLKAWDRELTLMRPISVYKASEEKIAFMYRIAGKGTAELSSLKARNNISIMGPLGNGFPCDYQNQRVALVGGGIGIPPLFETAKKLKAQGNQVDIFLGYKDELFAYEDYEEVADRIFIACENGDEGYRGFVTDLLHPENYDVVFTCGPDVMMMKVNELCKAKSVPVWLSMEKRMACGIGACLGCTCKTQSGMKRACKDGPVFNGNDIINE